MTVPTSTSVVGIRLQAPMQSWALAGRGAWRDSHTRPTKSGVIGLVANALGRDRDDSIDDLAALRFGVRVDAPGRIEVDYHVAGSGQYYALPGEVVNAPRWWGDPKGDHTDPNWMTYFPPKEIGLDKGLPTSNPANASLTKDKYLADASFLVALEGDADLVESVARAVAAPARALFLGRKAYAPASELLENLRESTTIEQLFESTAEGAIESATVDAQRAGLVDVYVEPARGSRGTVVMDQPVSFSGPAQRTARMENHYTLGTLTIETPADPVAEPVAVAAPDPDPVAVGEQGSLFDDIFEEGSA